MSTTQLSNAAPAARPTVEVRLLDGDGTARLIKRLSPGDADALVSRGWAEWIGRGRRRYVRLTAAAPVSSLQGSRAGDNTRPMTAGGDLERHKGQLLGGTRYTREHVESVRNS